MIRIAALRARRRCAGSLRRNATARDDSVAMLGHRITLVSALLLALLAPVAGAQTLEDLASPAVSCPDTYGQDIAADGTVVAGVWCPDHEAAALAGPGATLHEVTSGYGSRIGDGGHLAVARRDGTHLWHPAGEARLVPLNGYPDVTVRDIAPDGRAVGQSSVESSTSFSYRATLWSALGVPTQVPGLPGDTGSGLVALTGTGWMAGSSGWSHAWRRSPLGQYTKLTAVYARRDWAAATAMSSAGDVLGESEDKGLRRLHVVWPAGSVTPQVLPTPRRGSVYFSDVNASRVVVGEAYVSGDRRAYAWSARSGLVDLNRYAPAGFVLRSAYAVNDAGQVTGFGNRGGHDHAFRLTLPNGF